MKSILLLLLLIISFAYLTFSFDGLRVELTHSDSKENLSKEELIHRATARTRRRLNAFGTFTSTNITNIVRPSPDMGEYLMELAIGTPPSIFPAIMDTGSDLIWTQCQPCKSCFSQPTTIYDPYKSSSVSSIPCNSSFYLYLCNHTRGNTPPACYCSYNYTYGTGWTNGVLDNETFTFGSTNPIRIPNITFGCSSSSDQQYFNGSAGIVGLARGNLSLVSQLRAGKFSYCLTNLFDTKNTTSPLLLGPIATLNGERVKSTPFVPDPKHVFYYLGLKGISIGMELLNIPPDVFSLKPDRTGGLIIDSGTTVTSLVPKAYLVVRQAVTASINLPITNGSNLGLDLCFSLPSQSETPLMPNMTFHFDGADMVLPGENYMVRLEDLFCLFIFNASDAPFSVFGNYQQYNMHILYDLENEFLSFVPAECDKL